MKKIIILLLAIFPFFSFAQDKISVDIIGTWEGTDKGDVGSFIFEKDGYAYLKMNEQIMGGKEFDMDGVKASMTYNFNFEVSPVEVDIIITLLETKDVRKLEGIVRFLDNNTMDMAMNFNDERPKDFENSKDVIRLYRKDFKK